MRKILDNKIGNTLALFIYTCIYTWMLFSKEEGMQTITMILISIFTFLCLWSAYSLSTWVYRLFVISSAIFFIPIHISNDFVGGLSNAHFMAFFLTDVKESASYIKVIPLSIVAKSVGIAVLLFYFLKAKLIKINNKIAWA